MTKRHARLSAWTLALVCAAAAQYVQLADTRHALASASLTEQLSYATEAQAHIAKFGLYVEWLISLFGTLA